MDYGLWTGEWVFCLGASICSLNIEHWTLHIVLHHRYRFILRLIWYLITFDVQNISIEKLRMKLKQMEWCAAIQCAWWCYVCISAFCVALYIQSNFGFLQRNRNRFMNSCMGYETMTTSIECRMCFYVTNYLSNESCVIIHCNIEFSFREINVLPLSGVWCEWCETWPYIQCTLCYWMA